MLTERRQFFENAGQLAYSLQAASKLLSGGEEDDGAMDLLSRAADELADVAALSQDLNNLSQKAEEARYQVEDLAASVAMLAADVDFSPKERDAVEERLDVIYRLRRKYGATIEEVLSYHDKASKELGELENADDRKDEMMEKYHRTLTRAREIASELSKRRRQAAEELETKIVRSSRIWICRRFASAFKSPARPSLIRTAWMKCAF